MIYFNYNGSSYIIVSWSVQCGLMEIKKEGGKISRFIQYDDTLKLTDFLSKLENVNFM